MTDTTKRFLLGLFLGCVVTCAVFAAGTFFRWIAAWGTPIIYFDDKARVAVTQEGFTLSASITDPYYYIDGFNDHNVFIAFSGPRDELDSIVEKKSGKKIATLAAWK
ncbi:MAG TPA: hypothetical protein VGM23_12215, partial [Armatimonadota bacterium]